MSGSITRNAAIGALAALAIGAAVAVPAGLGQSSPKPPPGTQRPPSPRPSETSQAIYKMTGSDVSATFTDLLSMTSEVETVEYMEAGERGPQFGRSLGKAKPPTVTLRRPMTYGLGLAQWHTVARTGKPEAFKTVVLELHSGGQPVARWQLVNAWPSKLEVAPVRDVLTETVTFAADELIRDSPN